MSNPIMYVLEIIHKPVDEERSPKIKWVFPPFSKEGGWEGLDYELR